jgi:hypothetical protein
MIQQLFDLVANELHCVVLTDFGFGICKKLLYPIFSTKKERSSAVKKNAFWIKLKGLGLYFVCPLLCCTIKALWIVGKNVGFSFL